MSSRPGANPFETGARKVIPAVLVYASRAGRLDSDDCQWLMIHKTSDHHAGKWNALGGKQELGESPLEAAQREFAEESGLHLELDAFRPLGFLTFPQFKAHKEEDWFVTVFVVDVPAELTDTLQGSPEGELTWVPDCEILKLNLWPGDRYFVPYILRREPFIGTIWYRGSEVIKHWMTSLSITHHVQSGDRIGGNGPPLLGSNRHGL